MGQLLTACGYKKSCKEIDAKIANTPAAALSPSPMTARRAGAVRLGLAAWPTS